MLRLLFFFLLLLPEILPAQEVYTEQFVDREGFSSPTIYDLLTDEKNFIWEGTESGLVRFDGTHFKTTKGYQGSVSYLAIDAFSQIWCYAFSGKVFVLKNDSLEEPFRQLGYIYQYAVSGKNIYLRTKNTISIYDALSFAKIAEPYSSRGVDTLLSLTDFCLFGDSLMVSRFQINVSSNPVVIKGNSCIGKFDYPYSNDYLNSIYQGTYAGKKLKLSHHFADWGGLLAIDLKSGQLKRIEASSWIGAKKLTSTTLSTYNDSAFWVNTYDGSYLVDAKSFLPIRYILPRYSVTDIVRDFQGNYWVSTLKNGLLKIPSFDLYRLDNLEKGWPDNSCFTITDGPNNGLFIGHGNGTITQIDADGHMVDTLHSSTNKEVEALCWDSSREQLFAVLLGLWYKNTNDKSEWVSAHAGSSTKHIQRVGDSVFYQMRNNSPVYLLTWKNGKLEDDSPDFTQNINLDDIAWDNARKKVWAISRSRGLWMRGENGKTVLFDSTAKASRLFIRKGKLWLLDPEKGVFIYDPDTRQNTSICPLLCTDAHPRIFTSDEKYVYVLCENKLIRIDAESPHKIHLLRPGFSFSFYNIKDMRCKNGQLWFATLVGLYSIPVNALGNFSAPGFEADKLFVIDPKNNYSATDELAYNQNNLRLNFNFVDYSGFGYKLVYRLKSDGSWQELEQNTRNLQLLALSPDRYDLELAMVDPSGKYQVLYAKQFEILSPFWKRWWFSCLIIFVILGIFFIIFRSQLRTLQMTNRLALSQSHYQEQLRTWQLSAIRAQLNPHFMYNILNAIQGSIAINDKQKAEQIITLFADLSRKVLDASNTENSNLKIEIETIQLYLELENIRFNGELNYSIDIEQGIDISRIHIPSLLIQPLVENAVVHGLWHKKGQKCLVLRVKKEERGFLIEIEDNGIGLEASTRINAKRHQHDSFGLKAIRKRLKLVMQESGREIIFSLENNSNGAEGAIARVVLPVEDKG